MNSSDSVNKLTHTRLLARNTIYNLLGQVAPLIAAIFAIPLLIHNLGTSRFGVLTLAWMVLGYFGLFDLGLGRVVTMLVGQKLGGKKADEIPAIVWTGFLFMLLIGLVSMVVVFLISPALVRHILKIPADLQQESLRAFIILGCAVPIVTSTAGIRGVLEAYQQFGRINIVRTVNGLYTFLVPLAVSYFSIRLNHIVLFLALGRLFILVLYFIFCFYTVPELKKKPAIHTGLARPMFRLGGWMSVSNIIGPVMVYFDRFLIGAWLSVAAVAYYVTPYEVVTKLTLITAAVSRVLFPAFSTSHGVDNRRMTILYSRGIRVLIAALFPI
ncbi:MAG: oligosaccharide flippase family protein, partial [Calditrichaeota bacterium]|nr:oligosaccharide flippase family protein [Calditrichota bacterium]